MQWIKSVRAISVVLVILSLSVGLFIGKISSDNYLQLATIIVGSYFVKRDK